jgi:hypothetical protein
MGRVNFWKLHGLIRNHVVFQRGSQGPPQVKSQHQLLVLLAYMWTEGTGMNNANARNLFYTSAGSAEAMRDRVATAIYGELLNIAIFWPCPTERKVINQFFFENFQIPNVSSIVDGTLFGLQGWPSPQREKMLPTLRGGKGGTR